MQYRSSWLLHWPSLLSGHYCQHRRGGGGDGLNCPAVNSTCTCEVWGGGASWSVLSSTWSVSVTNHCAHNFPNTLYSPFSHPPLSLPPFLHRTRRRIQRQHEDVMQVQVVCVCVCVCGGGGGGGGGGGVA